MESTSLVAPRFRPSVEVELEQERAVFKAASGVHVLRFPAEGRPAMERLIVDLRQGGASTSALTDVHDEIDGLPELLGRLDDLHLLTESHFALPEGVISGSQLDRDVRRMVRRLHGRLAPSRFHAALIDGTATRGQLIGYALEYYWLVRAAPALVAPSLATAASPKMRAALQEFLVSELDHDRYLLKVLRAAGVDDDLDGLQPLPTTFQVCASLGAYAQQHPLSFQAALFLFEQPQPAFVEAFETRCAALRLPKEFYVPLRQHSGVNEDADHGSISTRLLALVPAVSVEERVVVLRNVSVMAETMILQEHEILDYYGDASRRSPRVFD